jgi:hypothetical protein
MKLRSFVTCQVQEDEKGRLCRAQMGEKRNACRLLAGKPERDQWHHLFVEFYVT